MTPDPSPTALIAEDEPLLASALQHALATAWPELRIVAVVNDGCSAVEQALALVPDVLFLDIRMPGLSGLHAAADIADGWNAGVGGRPFPELVFVTAYEQYAVQAFEARAVDYLLKPLQAARLRRTVERLQQAMANRLPSAAAQPAAGGSNPALDRALDQLRQLLPIASASVQPSGLLRVLQASVGNVIHMVPLDHVLVLEAADKYVRVLTARHEYLIRTPLRELLPQLDATRFWQVHRAHVVRVDAVDTVSRDEAGKAWLQLRGRSERIPVSRLYAHLFKAM